MADRRSGVDLFQQGNGWAVAYNGRVLSLHANRREALAAARLQSKRVMTSRLVFGQTATLPRLLKDRRHRHRRDGAHDE